MLNEQKAGKWGLPGKKGDWGVAEILKMKWLSEGPDFAESGEFAACLIRSYLSSPNRCDKTLLC